MDASAIAREMIESFSHEEKVILYFGVMPPGRAWELKHRLKEENPEASDTEIEKMNKEVVVQLAIQGGLVP